MLAALLILQLQASGQPAKLSRADSVAAVRLVARARREEAKLFWLWRHEWQKLRDLNGTDPRFWSLHCHADDAEPGDIYNVITSMSSRKSMCPIWFQGYGTRADENENIDNAIPAKSRDRVRAARARVITLLDSAARLRPEDPWVLGQRVRLMIDQRELARAALIVADECRTIASLCAMFDAYVQSKSGNRTGASRAFTYAASLLNQEDRCYLLDARAFFDDEDRRRYEKMSCAERDTLNERFWWLADPLWSERGNERLAVHLERQTLIIMKSAVTADEHFDYRHPYGGSAVKEMLIRYGWPSVSYHHLQEHENHNGWLGFKDSASNASREYTRPRYHSTPNLASLTDWTAIPAFPDMSPPWLPKKQGFDEFWWPIEHFPRPGALTAMDYQAAALRRRRGPLVAVAVAPVSPRLAARDLGDHQLNLIAMRNPRDTATESSAPALLEATGAVVSTIGTKTGLQVISAEVTNPARDSSTSARARFAITVPPGLDSLARGQLAVSDPILFAPFAALDTLPMSPFDALARMLPTTTITSDRVGLFVELYGIAQSDSVDLTLTARLISRPNLFGRIASMLGGNSPDSTMIRWESGRAGASNRLIQVDGASIATRSLILNLRDLAPGRYAVDVTVRTPNRPPASARREFELRR